MPEDFFAQGFDDVQGIIFTKQQNQFLQSKLPFLDPRKSYQIQMGNVISLLKFSQLQSTTILKIIKNCCGQNSKTVTYEQMKKIFRGVALKQNKIQPSKINIQANIKTPLPLFYDDDSENQQQQQKPQPKAKTQKPTVPSNQPPPQKIQPVKQQPPQQPQQMDPIQMWDSYWKNLKTKNNLIDGAQVKKICANNNTNKNNLSKAWKLCNISEKGYLTKGQCFVFMNLINAPSIPDSLNKQMLDMIKKIQQTCGYKKSSTSQARTSSSSANTTKPKQMSASNVFQKFGQPSLFQKKPSQKQQQSLRNSSIQPNNALNLVSGVTPNKNPTLQKAQNLIKQSKSIQNDITKISTNNQTLFNSLQHLQKNFIIIQQNFIQAQNKVLILKQNQKILNDKLNNVCFSMKKIIQKQSQCINTLMQNIHQQNQMNIQRIKVLQNYTNQMNKIVDNNLQHVKGQVINGKNKQDVTFQQAQQKSQVLREKLSNFNGIGVQNQSSSRIRQSVTFKQNQKMNKMSSPQNRKSDPFADDQHQKQPHYQYNAVNQRVIQSTKQQQPVRLPAQTSQQNFNQQGTQAIDIQHLTEQQKIKIKHMQLIQLVNYITPIKRQQYAGVAQRITSMSQQQMSTLYKKLYQMYLKKQQQKLTQHKKQFPNTDQFNTSQFINQDTLKNYKNQNYIKN